MSRPQIEHPRDRVIVALDVATPGEALQLVDELGGVISFYKIGYELFLSGSLDDLLSRLQEKQVFVDLKVPDDIAATIQRVVAMAVRRGVRFLTMSHSVGPATLTAAVQARSPEVNPGFLWVPFLSSLDQADYAALHGVPEVSEVHAVIAERCRAMKSFGIDGFIVSGPEIKLLRDNFPDTTLVSPGIRPIWASKDDHKRTCTPAEAIGLGADYIVVGRPIRNATDKRDAAKRIIDEIAEVVAGGGSHNGRTVMASSYVSGAPMMAKPR